MRLWTRISSTLVFLATFAVSLFVTATVARMLLAQDVPDPLPMELETSDEAMAQVDTLLDAVGSGNWALVTGAVALVLMYLLRRFGVWEKVGKKWAYRVLLVLGVVSSVASVVVGELSWTEALLVLLAAPGGPWIVQAVQHGFLGQEHSTPMEAPNKRMG